MNRGKQGALTWRYHVGCSGAFSPSLLEGYQRFESAFSSGEPAKEPVGDLVSRSLCSHMLGRRKWAEVKRRVLLDAVAIR